MEGGREGGAMGLARLPCVLAGVGTGGRPRAQSFAAREQGQAPEEDLGAADPVKLDAGKVEVVRGPAAGGPEQGRGRAGEARAREKEGRLARRGRRIAGDGRGEGGRRTAGS